MSGGEGKTTWELDLDLDSAAGKLTGFAEQIDKLGEGEALTHLMATFESVGLVVGVLGAAVFGIKESFDLVFDAERINAVNQQFELLSKNAGVYSEKLKEGLVNSSGGLIEETELLKIANRELINLGHGAERLPELMEVARKASVVSGQDLKATFETLARAVETGNTRLLRHAGIVIDQHKAYAEYAKQIGTTVDLLSQQGKQQAVLNAVIEKGNSQLAGVDESALKATNAWTQFKVAMSEIGEVLTLFYAKTLGPVITKIVEGFAYLAHSAKTALVGNIGEGAAQAEARIKSLGAEMERVKKVIADYGDASKVHGNAKIGLDGEIRSLQRLQGEYDKYKAKLESLHSSEKAGNEKSAAQKAALAAQEGVDQEKLLQRKRKLAAESAKLKTEEEQLALKSATKISQVDMIFMDREVAMKREANAQIEQLEAQHGAKYVREAGLRAQIERNTDLKIKAMDLDLFKERQAALDRYAAKSQTVSEGITRTWAAASNKQLVETNKFVEPAKKSYAALENNAISTFQAIGDGSKSASEAMAGFVLSSIGDMAEAYGEMYVKVGIASLNPAVIVEGGALIALGAFLKSKGGGGGSSSAGSAGGGGGGASPALPATGPDTSGTSNAGPAMSAAAPEHNITFQVQGNLYSSNEAKTEMMDLMRQATDATGYKYQQVGGG